MLAPLLSSFEKSGVIEPLVDGYNNEREKDKADVAKNAIGVGERPTQYKCADAYYPISEHQSTKYFLIFHSTCNRGRVWQAFVRFFNGFRRLNEGGRSRL